MSDRSPLIQILKSPPVPGAPPPEGGGPGAQFPEVIARLRSAAEARPRPAADEPCEMCGVDIAPDHGHVVDLTRRSLMCVCRGCYLLFDHDGAGGSRFRAVPVRYLALTGCGAAGDDWEALDLPIGLAFFMRNGATGRVTAFYPSPAGATESELPLGAWSRVVEAVPALGSLADDVEACVVRRTDAGTTDAFIVPIDVCYELVGCVRREWAGITGGSAVRDELDAFFAHAREQAGAAA